MDEETYKKLIEPLSRDTRCLMAQDIRRRYRLPLTWQLGDPIPEETKEVTQKSNPS
jgi:hypothetical protein